MTRLRYQTHKKQPSVTFVDHLITDIKGAVYPVTISSCINDPQWSWLKSLYTWTFGILNQQSDNPYIFHKAVPSARNMHPNQGYLYLNGNILRFNPKLNDFEWLAGLNPEPLDGTHTQVNDSDIEIIVVADLWRIMKYYGAFGAALAMLDAGHILGQLKFLLGSAEDLTYHVDFLKNREAFLTAIGDKSNNQMVVFSLRISSLTKFYPWHHGNISQPAIERREDYTTEISAYQEVETLRHHCHQPQKQVTKTYRVEKADSLDRMMAQIKARESHHTHMGLHSLWTSLSKETYHHFFSTLSEMLKQQRGPSGTLSIYAALRESPETESSEMGSSEKAMHIFQLTNQGGLVPVRSLPDVIGHSQEVSAEPDKILNDSHHYFNMASHPMVIFIVASDQEDWSDQDHCYYHHLNSGEIAQYICLVASQFDLYARPIKNFNDEYLESTLLLASDQRILYAILIGKGNSRHLNLPIGNVVPLLLPKRR